MLMLEVAKDFGMQRWFMFQQENKHKYTAWVMMEWFRLKYSCFILAQLNSRPKLNSEVFRFDV